MRIRVDLTFALGQYVVAEIVCEELQLLPEIKKAWSQGFSVASVEVVPDVTPLKTCPLFDDVVGFAR